MKYTFFLALSVSVLSVAPLKAQWSNSADNITTGRILLNTGGTSTTNDDITISKNKPGAGILIMNSSLTGRSVIMFGYDYGGKYGYISHHASSYDAGAGYTQTYKPASTILTGADVNGLGLISSGDIRFNAGGDHDSKFRMIINSVGNVGIGTSTPAEQLHVNGHVAIEPDNASTPKYLSFKRASDGWVAARIGQRYSMQSWAGDLIFETNTGTGQLNLEERMRISYNGNVSIGTTDPKGYKLAVKGKIVAEEIVVKLNSAWPDYVFDPSYKLPSLTEVDRYIHENRHLPGVPSAEEISEKGLSVGEMNSLLLKKVEELTLHVIELQKQNDRQDKFIHELKNK